MISLRSHGVDVGQAVRVETVVPSVLTDLLER